MVIDRKRVKAVGDFAKQLARGIVVEGEHGGTKAFREKIAKDHLREHKDYYTRLTQAGL